MTKKVKKRRLRGFSEFFDMFDILFIWSVFFKSWDFQNKRDIFKPWMINNSRKRLVTNFALADVFVLPSGLGETWGLVVNEAMCFGLPVIVSDIAGCGPDLVRNGVNGFIFKSGDVNELADILGRLIADRAGRAALGKKSFEIVQKYSFDADIYGLKKALSIHD